MNGRPYPCDSWEGETKRLLTSGDNDARCALLVENDGEDQRGNDTYLIYNLEIEKAGCYEFSIRVATIFDTSHLEFALDNCPTGKLQIRATGDGQIWSTQGPVKLDLAAGEHIFNIYIRDQECNHGVNINWFEFKSMNS